MRDIDDGYPTLDVFDAIHRELVTIIGHCTFHRSVLQDLLLRQAAMEDAPQEALQRWRDESMRSIDRLRFSDLHKSDKALAAAVFDEASRTAETFWNLLLSQAEARDRVDRSDVTVALAPSTDEESLPYDRELEEAAV